MFVLYQYPMFVLYQYPMFVPYQYPMLALYQYPMFVPYQYPMLAPYQYTMFVPYQYTMVVLNQYPMFVPSQYSMFECHQSFKAYVLQGSCWSLSAFVTLPCISTGSPIIPFLPPHRCWQIIGNYEYGGKSTMYCSPCHPNISGTVTGLLTGWLAVWFVAVKSDFLFSRTSSLAWGPPSLFLIHTGVCFPRVKQHYCRFDLSASSSAGTENEWNNISARPVSSWCAKGQLYLVSCRPGIVFHLYMYLTNSFLFNSFEGHVA
jgi:hypothetical protein